MKTIQVRTVSVRSFGRKASFDGNVVTIIVKSFYNRAQFWIGLALAVSSVFGVVYQFYPQYSKAGLVAGLLASLATFLQNNIPANSVVSND